MSGLLTRLGLLEALDDGRLDPYEFRVYVHLFRSGRSGDTQEPQQEMANACLISRKTVNEVLTRLENKGWIRQERCRKGGNQAPNLITVFDPPAMRGKLVRVGNALPREE